MSNEIEVDGRISSWLEADVPTRLPDRVLHATFERTRKSSQHRRSRALLGSVQVNRTWAAVAGAALVVVAVAGWGLGAGQPGVGGVPATPTADASPIATATPTVRAKASFVVARPGEGRSLGWSRDGTRLLLQKGDGNLFVVHTDGSETQVTDQLSRLQAIPGSSRPSGATISPDGARVVFAGLTEEGHFCHFGALFAVDADGGPAEILWKSHVPENGIVRDPTFSPDGTRLAFVDDYCDNDHNVWVMNADGSDAQKIVPDPIGGGHVGGLAWSPAGDRIALVSDRGTYTFAPDGSDLVKGGRTSEYCWPDLPC